MELTIQLLVVSSIGLWVLLVLNFLLVLALVQRQNTIISATVKSSANALLGQPAPTFTAQTVSGEQITLSNFASRKLAMVFVSPTCGPCRDELPLIQSLHSNIQLAGMDLVLVSNADLVNSQSMVKEFELTMPI